MSHNSFENTKCRRLSPNPTNLFINQFYLRNLHPPKHNISLHDFKNLIQLLPLPSLYTVILLRAAPHGLTRRSRIVEILSITFYNLPQTSVSSTPLKQSFISIPLKYRYNNRSHIVPSLPRHSLHLENSLELCNGEHFPILISHDSFHAINTHPAPR